MDKKNKNRLNIELVCGAADKKDRDFYDNLSEEDRKNFVPFVTLKWMATVNNPWYKDKGKGFIQSSFEREAYYVRSANIHANKNLFSLSKHPKLQWLMITAISPGLGKMKHGWVGKKHETKNQDIFKKMSELYPSMKPDDLRIWSSMITKKEFNEFLKKYGEE